MKTSSGVESADGFDQEGCIVDHDPVISGTPVLKIARARRSQPHASLAHFIAPQLVTYFLADTAAGVIGFSVRATSG
jgi:hypothetical protein